MIKAVIFDCWETLFTNAKSKMHPFERCAESLGRSRSDYAFLKALEKYFMLKEEKSLDVPIRQFLSSLGEKRDGEELKKIISGAVRSGRPYPETLNVLRALKRKYKLGMITNTFYLSIAHLENKYHIRKHFDVVLTSYEQHMLKPDPRLFRLMARKLGVKPSEMLMVGDSLRDDVIAAKKAGLHAVLIDRKKKYPNFKQRITSLRQVETEIRKIDDDMST